MSLESCPRARGTTSAGTCVGRTDSAMIIGHASGNRHDQRCCRADAGGMGGWGFSSAPAEVLPGRYAAWSDPALGGIQSRWALVRQVLRAWPSRGAGGRQIVHHPGWPLYLAASGLRPTREQGERHLAPSGARKPAGTQRHHRWDHPTARNQLRQDPCPPRYGHQGQGPRERDILDWAPWPSSEDHRQLDLRLEDLACIVCNTDPTSSRKPCANRI